MKPKDNQHIYESLAYIYDDLMKSISYEDWSDFIDEVIQTHFEEAESILELGCGTGKFALSLDELDYYDITASDFSEKMLEMAQIRSDYVKSSIIWKQIDFRNIQEDQTYDVVLMLFDTINYCQSEQDFLAVLAQVKRVLAPDGIFVFDFTTPINSENASDSLNEEGVSGNYRFERKNYFLPLEKFHYNEFIIEELDDLGEPVDTFREIHRQRIYTLDEVRAIIAKSDFQELAAYEGFDLVDATAKSDRITVVLR